MQCSVPKHAWSASDSGHTPEMLAALYPLAVEVITTHTCLERETQRIMNNSRLFCGSDVMTPMLAMNSISMPVAYGDAAPTHHGEPEYRIDLLTVGNK